jgi:predicted kinase
VLALSLVVVSGLPGAGKTTLAVPLAAALDVPLLAKDTVKEALFDSLGTGDRAWSRRLGAASMAVVFALAAVAPRAVLESFWRRPQALERLRALDRPLVEVHCGCPAELARARYRARERHPGHDGVGDDEIVGWVADAGPLGPGPVLEVDTAAPVDVDAVARWVGERW